MIVKFNIKGFVCGLKPKSEPNSLKHHPETVKGAICKFHYYFLANGSINSSLLTNLEETSDFNPLLGKSCL